MIEQESKSYILRKDKKDEPEDMTFDCVDLPPLLPEGQYIVCFIRPEKSSMYGKDKVYLWFEIFDGDYRGERLYMPATLTKRLGPSSKLGKLRSVVCEGRPAKGSLLNQCAAKQVL